MSKIAIGVVGASGFVGSACHTALSEVADVRAIKAPRFVSNARTPAAAHDEIVEGALRKFSEETLDGIDVLVNAAGLATATSSDYSALVGANTILPLFLSRSAEQAGVKRFVHISSAAVQGRALLDESERLRPESPYAFSKAWGEALLREPNKTEVIRYRPTSVHGPTRGVTRQLARLAQSPFAAVAAPGTDPTPQVPVESVAEAVLWLSDLNTEPPSVVLHPWVGTTTASFLEDLGGGRPHRVPRAVARATVEAAFAAERAMGSSRANARRLEMLLFGQRQTVGWLGGRLRPPPKDWVRRCGDHAIGAERKGT